MKEQGTDQAKTSQEARFGVLARFGAQAGQRV